jgi:four helix bundle protein
MKIAASRDARCLMNDQLPNTKYQTISNSQLVNDQKEEKSGKTYDLEERTTKFAEKVIVLCKKLPGNSINFELISQLVRAAGSVGANYREANDALSKRDFYYRLKITRKETKESNHWLDLILIANPSVKSDIDLLKIESFELKKIFSSIINKSRQLIF